MSGAPAATLGARYEGEGRCAFRVWAPRARAVALRLVRPVERVVPLAAVEDGYHEAVVDGVEPGARYLYRLDGALERPDPASRSQPEGVHGPSEVVDDRPDAHGVDLVGGWAGLPLAGYVLYELHVGTFTAEGTFDAVIPHLDGLRELGVTALELMPIAQFPGARNWGYDGVYPWAVQGSYGGPAGLRRLVAACHARGLAVVLDVVMNHLGPEGNYLADFGPYFTARYTTPWGAAVNVDGPGSDEVRRYFLEHCLRWFVEFQVDALRVDAVHEIHDRTARPFLEELSGAVRACAGALGRPLHLIAESNQNDPRIVRPPEAGGLGFDAHWADDLHHALHVALTGEQGHYYADYAGVADLARALERGYVLEGERSGYRGRRHGRPAEGLSPASLVVCAQNHDQVGNRPRGERLSTLVPPDAQRLAAATVLLSPFTPLLFMGEEYGETAPFPYFTSHGDPDLAEAVRRGRRAEFPGEDPPDPQAPATFQAAVLRRPLERGPHRELLAYHRELLALRRELEAALGPARAGRLGATADPGRGVVVVRRRGEGGEALLVLSFAADARSLTLELAPGAYARRLDSSEARWGGPGCAAPAALQPDPAGRASLTLPPRSCALYLRGAR